MQGWSKASRLVSCAVKLCQGLTTLMLNMMSLFPAFVLDFA